MSRVSAADAVRALLAAAGDRADDDPGRLDGALDELGIPAAERGPVLEAILRSRREQARLRRREHELTELFTSARELAELRDSSALLERLVERARGMMGSDVAYLSEFDAGTGALRVRTTSGSVSPAFRTLEVPPGRGLASAVVESRAPQWVARYREYPPDRHETGIDDAVAAEGLVSLLGVPMLGDGEVLGVLFVATREEVEFAPEQIAVLSALADHASVVLRTADILRSLQRSDDEARASLDRLSETLRDRDRANTVHQELVQAVLAGGGFEPVARTLAAALDRTVTVIDDAGEVIASSGPLPMVLDVDGWTAIAESRASGHCARVAAAEEGETVAALTAGAQYFGAILLGPAEHPLTPVDERTVERAAQVGALLALQRQAVAEAERRLQSELMADVLSARPERRADGIARAHRRGIALAELDSVALVEVAGEQRAAAARALGAELGSRSLVGEHRGYVVAVFDGSRATPDPERMRASLAATVDGPVLLVLPPADAERLPESFAEAARTARLLHALDVHDRAVRTIEFLPYSSVLDADPATLRAFLDSSIGAVRDYDRDRGTELLATLRVFLRSGASPTRTARELSFHPNTIVQRLDRLTALLGEDWRDDERLFRLSLAVRLDELRERLRSPSPVE